MNSEVRRFSVLKKAPLFNLLVANTEPIKQRPVIRWVKAKQWEWNEWRRKAEKISYGSRHVTSGHFDEKKFKNEYNIVTVLSIVEKHKRF